MKGCFDAANRLLVGAMLAGLAGSAAPSFARGAENAAEASPARRLLDRVSKWRRYAPGQRMPDRLVELQQNPQTRRLLGILRKARVLPYVPSHGCSRVPGGPLEFSAASKSNKALLSRVPAPGKDALRFVFDPTQGIIAVDERGLDDRRQPWKPFFKGSHHQRMAQIIGAFLKLEEGGIDYTAAGGMIRWTQEKPGDPWVLETSEKSPHTGHAWNPAVRRQFEEFVRDQLGVEHRHIPGV